MALRKETKMNKEKLASMFGIETYEKENRKLNGDIETLSGAYDLLKDANTILAHDVVKMEKELDRIKEDPEKYIEEEVERRVCEEIDKLPDRIRARAFAEGRMSAYSEMGIWRLEAIERGNNLVMLQNGDIVELIAEDLVDVKDEGSERVLRSDLIDEIIIDDLQDIGA